MKPVHFGRKIYSFGRGEVVLTTVSVTEKAVQGEDENAFIDRLLAKYRDKEGTLEIVFKHGRPSHGVITFS